MYPCNFYSILIPHEERALPSRDALDACFERASKEGWSDQVKQHLLDFLQTPVPDEERLQSTHLLDFLFCWMKDGRWRHNGALRRCIEVGISILREQLKISGDEDEQGQLRLLEDTFCAISGTEDELAERLAKLCDKDRMRLFQGYLQVAGHDLRIHEVCLKRYFSDELFLLECARNYRAVSQLTTPVRAPLTVVKYSSPQLSRPQIAFVDDWMATARLFKLVADPAGYSASRTAQIADAAYVAKAIRYEMVRPRAGAKDVYLARDSKDRVQGIAVVTFKKDIKSVNLDYLMTNPENLNVVEAKDDSRVRGAGTAIVTKIVQDALEEGCTTIDVHPLDSCVNWYRDQFGFQDVSEGISVLREDGMRALVKKYFPQKETQSVLLPAPK